MNFISPHPLKLGKIALCELLAADIEGVEGICAVGVVFTIFSHRTRGIHRDNSLCSLLFWGH